VATIGQSGQHIGQRNLFQPKVGLGQRAGAFRDPGFQGAIQFQQVAIALGNFVEQPVERIQQGLDDCLIDKLFIEVGGFRSLSGLDGTQLPRHGLIGAENMAGQPVDEEL